MHLNFTANSFVFGHIKRENAPRNFLQSLQGENFQHAFELHSKHSFWAHKS